jgi:cellobiose phosphorylase
VQVGYARSFTFTDLAQYSSFSAIFDQYRITDIEVWLIPGLSTSALQSGVSGNYYTVTDYDDDTTPTSSTALTQYTNVMQTPLNQGQYRRWKPHVAEALYGGGAFTSYGNIPAPWIDVASNSVKHYGFKAISAGAASSGTVISFQLIVRIHFECRNVF